MIGYVAPPLEGRMLDKDKAAIGVNVDLKESQRSSKKLKESPSHRLIWEDSLYVGCVVEGYSRCGGELR